MKSTLFLCNMCQTWELSQLLNGYFMFLNYIIQLIVDDVVDFK